MFESISEQMPGIIMMFIMLGFSGFFSASETAFFSLSRFDVRKIQDDNPVVAERIKRLLKNPERLLITVLFGNMVVNVIYSTISAVVALRVGGGRDSWHYVAIVQVISLLVLIVFGEVLPKSLAIQRASWFAEKFGKFLTFFYRLVSPVYYLVPILDWFAPKKSEKRLVTRHELKALVDMGGKDGVLGRDEHRMLAEVVDFGEMKLKEVMVPRVDSVFCNVRASLEDFKKIARKTKHTKFLIYENEHDNVIGLIRAEDVFLAPEGSQLKEFVRPVQYIPETTTVEKALIALNRDRNHFAVVIDEYGGMEGLAAVEDIVEEIVGEIEDEFDQAGVSPIRKVDQDTYFISGNLNIRDWQEYFDIEIETPEFDTVGGFVTFLLGRIPSLGDRAHYGNIEFTVKGLLKGKRIGHVLMMVSKGSTDGEDG